MHLDFFQYLWNGEEVKNLFGGMPSILEKLIRTIVVYFVLVLVLRTFGKRKLTQLNPFDFVVLLLLSNTVQNAIIGNETTLPGGLIGAIFLIIISNLVVRLFYKLSWKNRDDILDGTTTVLIKDGVIQEKKLEDESITRLELESIAHDKGFNSTEEISNCVLEPNGKIFVEAKKPSSEQDNHAELMQKEKENHANLMRKEKENHAEILNKIEELSRQIAELQAAKT